MTCDLDKQKAGRMPLTVLS